MSIFLAAMKKSDQAQTMVLRSIDKFDTSRLSLPQELAVTLPTSLVGFPSVRFGQIARLSSSGQLCSDRQGTKAIGKNESTNLSCHCLLGAY